MRSATRRNGSLITGAGPKYRYDGFRGEMAFRLPAWKLPAKKNQGKKTPVIFVSISHENRIKLMKHCQKQPMSRPMNKKYLQNCTILLAVPRYKVPLVVTINCITFLPASKRTAPFKGLFLFMAVPGGKICFELFAKLAAGICDDIFIFGHF